MRRLTAGGIALFALTWAGSALALALGEMDVRSHLNQGFSAVVPVVAASDEELDSLTVRVADNAEFVRAGIDRSDYLSTLQFSVVKAADGASVVKIRSNDLAREPFVSFVIEARWSTGRLIREYTGLLDPQVTDLTPAPKATAPAAARPAAELTAPVVPAATTAPAGGEPQVARPSRPAKQAVAHVPATAAESAAGSYGPVAASETLWSIATRLQQNLGGTIDQILLTLYQKNPTAFEGGSINRVMQGVRLATPSAAEVHAIDPAVAQKKVAELRGLTSTVSEPKPEALKPEVAKPETATAQPPSPAAGEAPNTKGAAPGGSVQVAASPAPAMPSPSAASVPGDGASSASTGAADATAPAAASSATTEPAVAATPEAAPPPAPVAPPVATAAPSPKSDNELLLPALVGVGALLLGALVLLAIRRRRAVAEAVAGAAAFADMPNIGLPEKEGRDVLMEPKPEVDVSALSGQLSPVPVPALKPEPEQTPQPPVPEFSNTLGFEQAKAEEAQGLSASPDVTDPLADADFHLSYGLHEEAANILKSALLKEPARLDLKRKLADVYFAGRRGLEFQELAEQLRPQVDTAEWKHIVDLGRQLVPNAPIFKPTPSAQPFGVLPDIDLDEFDLSGDAAPKPTKPEAAKDEKPSTVAAPLSLDINSFDLATGGEDKPDRIEFNLDELDLAKQEDGEPSFALGDDFDTKLDLARAYADMGDSEAALNLLSEVVAGGNEKQKIEAKSLHDRLNS